MRIHEVTIIVPSLREAAAFYGTVLHLPVDEQPDRVTAGIGAGRLVLEAGDASAGIHHLAFGVSPRDFGRARRWLNERVDLVVIGGSEVVEAATPWNARSVYFPGPGGIVLEFIARRAEAATPDGGREPPSVLSISEVGIGVPDVTAAVATLADTLGLPPFPPQEQDFAPVGDHEGLLIVVDRHRPWFPTRTHRPAQAPLDVRVAAPNGPGIVELTEHARVIAPGCDTHLVRASPPRR